MAYVVGEHFITLINVADHLILPLVLSRERGSNKKWHCRPWNIEKLSSLSCYLIGVIWWVRWCRVCEKSSGKSWSECHLSGCRIIFHENWIPNKYSASHDHYYRRWLYQLHQELPMIYSIDRDHICPRSNSIKLAAPSHQAPPPTLSWLNVRTLLLSDNH